MTSPNDETQNETVDMTDLRADALRRALVDLEKAEELTVPLLLDMLSAAGAGRFHVIQMFEGEDPPQPEDVDPEEVILWRNTVVDAADRLVAADLSLLVSASVQSRDEDGDNTCYCVTHTIVAPI